MARHEQLTVGELTVETVRLGGLESTDLLQISPAADDTGSFNFGDGTTDIDVKVFLGSTTEYVLFDVGNSLVDIAGVPLSCPDGNTSKFIETGTYSSEADKGILLSATNNRPVSFLFDDGGDVIASGDVRGVLSRVAVTALHTGSVTLDAVRGHVKFIGGVDFDADYVSGVRGYLEIAGATDFGLNSAGHAASALHARVEVAGNVSVQTANSYLAGLFVELNTTGAYSVTQTGVLAGVAIDYTDQKNDKWGHGVYIADGACDTGITINSCADGITQAGTIVDFLNIGAAATVTNFIHFNAAAGCVTANALVPAAAPDAGTMGADAAIVCDIGGTPYYIPMYDTLHA